jgi:hypothetical protein
MLASVSRSQCGYIRMAEQTQAGPLPPHGAEPAPRALGLVTSLAMAQCNEPSRTAAQRNYAQVHVCVCLSVLVSILAMLPP